MGELRPTVEAWEIVTGYLSSHCAWSLSVSFGGGINFIPSSLAWEEIISGVHGLKFGTGVKIKRLTSFEAALVSHFLSSVSFFEICRDLYAFRIAV